MKHVFSLLATLALTACATTQAPMGEDPGRDSFSVNERPDGFVVSVAYSRYQFVPQTDAVLQACRASLLSTAHEVADKRGRAIEHIDEQRIQITTGRNIVTGMTSCEASVPVTWKS